MTTQDVLPTLLAAAEVQAEILQPIHGANAWPAMLGQSQQDPPDFAITGLNGEAYYRGGWKLVHLRGSEPELYQQSVDPTESVGLAEQEPELVSRLQEALEDLPRGENVMTTSW